MSKDSNYISEAQSAILKLRIKELYGNQEDCAQAAGLRLTTLNNAISGRHEPGISIAQKIAAALRWPIDRCFPIPKFMHHA